MIRTSILAWVPMVVIAIANGLFREQVFARRLTELRAHQASCGTGVLLFGLYVWLIISTWKPSSAGEAVTMGLIWLALTVAFEFLFGRIVVGHPWSRLLHDYNLRAGRLWILVLVWIAVAPYLVYRLQDHVFGPEAGSWRVPHV
ncbi:MAG: hypothetical protein MUD04_11205 [Cyanobium sp. Prado107]|jgi:hypothetical protein|nr:hypothetical protein [Cyanobium sp. Prado107]